jgi:hypothetical protein
VRADAADRDDRKLHRGAQLRESRGAERRRCVGLGARGRERAHADMVDDRGIDGRDLGLVAGGDGEDHVRTDAFARLARRHVVLADMQAMGADGDRHLDAVVDDQLHAAGREQLHQRAALLDQGGIARLLVAQLHERGAAGDRGRDGLLQAMAARKHRIGHQIDGEIEAGAHQEILA